MKHLALLGAATLAVALPLAADAASIAITFDEPGISTGTTVTSQYAGLGVTFAGSIAVVKVPGSNGLTNIFPSDGQIVHFDTQTVNANIALAVDANALSFEFRRPSNPQQNIGLKLFKDGNLVHDFGIIGWTGPDWDLFSYGGQFGLYDTINLTASNKFVLDNLSITTVPVPGALILLAGALPLLRGRRRT